MLRNYFKLLGRPDSKTLERLTQEFPGQPDTGRIFAMTQARLHAGEEEHFIASESRRPRWHYAATIAAALTFVIGSAAAGTFLLHPPAQPEQTALEAQTPAETTSASSETTSARAETTTAARETTAEERTETTAAAVETTAEMTEGISTSVQEIVESSPETVTTAAAAETAAETEAPVTETVCPAETAAPVEPSVQPPERQLWIEETNEAKNVCVPWGSLAELTEYRMPTEIPEGYAVQAWCEEFGNDDIHYPKKLPFIRSTYTNGTNVVRVFQFGRITTGSMVCACGPTMTWHDAAGLDNAIVAWQDGETELHYYQDHYYYLICADDPDFPEDALIRMAESISPIA